MCTAWIFALTLLMKRLGVIPLHLSMFSKEDVEKLVAKQGFQIVASAPMIR